MFKDSENTRAYLSFAVLFIVTLLMVGLFFIEMPEDNSNLVNTALGFIAGWAGAIFSFYFGSSSTGNSNRERDGKDK